MFRVSTRSREAVLVCATDAIRLCREGDYRALARMEACSRFERLDTRSRWGIRLFVAQARLTSRPLPLLKDREVVDLVLAAIRQRELVMLDGHIEAAAKSDDQTAERRRLVKQIAARTHDNLSLAGRRYKLVADVDLLAVSGRGNYQVVPQLEARVVLDALAQQSGAELGGLLARARQELTPDWRPPLAPDGLVLLRRNHILQGTRPSEEPAITPSQLKRLMERPPEELIDWCIWVELDPDDPKAHDDVLVLLDSCYQEVQRVKPVTMARSGDGVIVVFKQIGRDTRYSLVKDYGPDEGGGMDPLFIDSTPREIDERRKRSS